MVVKCKMCGGDILFQPGDTVGQCEYCGSSGTIPKVDEEQKINRYNRANHFRRQSEFDKAISAYEKILEEDDTDSEAHWGIVLSKYGIEYVEDPVTHERIPTCHRVQPDSILADEDYLAAVKNAPDTASREIYEKEAKRIAEIQKGILSISSQEKPYDVFICYKETEDSGSRTKDSALAQEIYYQLTNEGFKVFFSRITLEDKLGQEYEPYIFAALNSAKVMLVVGTTPEHFNAVWVKNEWSRYLALMRSDRKRILIPCYRDMDPYDLPEEMSSLQSQDMSKIGFMQDIIHGVKKVLEVEKKDSTPTVSLTGPGVASLHKRALLFLEDGDWDSAQEYYDRILDIDPEYAPAYIGKVQIKQRARKETDLARAKEPFTEDPDYQKAVRFANEQQKAVYQGYNRAIEERIDREKKESIYREADALEKRAAVENEFLAAAQMFDGAGEIRDAKERAANCRAKAASAKAEAEKAAAVYKEQMERERQERARQEEERRLQEEKRAQEEKIEKEKRARQERIEKEKRAKRNKKVFAVAAVLAVLASGAYFGNEKILQPRLKYNQAEKLLESGEYDQAVSAFTDMEGYGDSAERILEAHYKKGEKLLAEGQLGLAQQSFISAGEYSDARQMASKIGEYYTAGVYLTQQNYADAHAIYAELGDFLDSKQQFNTAAEGLYMQLRSSVEKKDFETAGVYLAELGDYSDCKTIAAGFDAAYEEAMSLWGEKKKTDAEDKLISILGWKDSKEKLPALLEEIADDAFVQGEYQTALKYYAALDQSKPEIQQKINQTNKQLSYSLAEEAFASGDLSTALQRYSDAGDYSDAAAQADRIRKYQAAEESFAAADYISARTAYAELGDYLDASAKLAQCSQTLYDEATALLNGNKTAEAYDAFSRIADYADSARIVSQIDERYAAAAQLLADRKYDEAAAEFKKLYNFKDSATMALESAYQKAEAFFQQGEYESAFSAYLELGSYGGSDEKALLSKYRIAEGLLEKQDIDGAIAAFEEIAAYSDSQDRANEIRYQKAASLWQAGELQQAAEQYRLLGGYKDAASSWVKVSTELADASMKAGDYATAFSAYQALEQTDEIREREYQLAQLCFDKGLFETATSAYEALGQYQLSVSKLPVARYAWADQLFTEGQYEKAAEQFAMLGGMTDSETRAKESLYQLASQKLESGDYDRAKSLYTQLTGYLDASEQAKESDYRKGCALIEKGEYKEAQSLFESLGAYADSALKRSGCIYAQAEALLAGEDFEGARKLYESIDYSDSEEKAKHCAYMEAERLYGEQKYAEAEKLYADLNGYKESAERAKDCHLQQGHVLMQAGDYARALEFFESVEYGDSAQSAAKCHYELGHAAQLSGDVDAAVMQYADAVSLPEAQAALLSIGKDYSMINELDKAIQTLWLIRDQEASRELLTGIAADALKKGNEDSALLAYLALGERAAESIAPFLTDGYLARLEMKLASCTLLPEHLDYKNSCKYEYEENIKRRDYQTAVAQQEAGEYEEAIAGYRALNGYSDSAARIEACETAIKEREYQAAAAQLKAGKYTEAYAAFKELTGYKDVDSLLKSDENLLAIAREEKRKPYKTVGNIVTFGTYPQTGSGSDKTPVEWIVLDVQENKSLLISRYGLDAKPYNEKEKNITWERCTLRTWLNGTFLNEAFTVQEQTGILTTNVDNSWSQENSIWSASGGNNTQDRVFLLSYAEAEKYFATDGARKSMPTDYAVKQGALTSKSEKVDGKPTCIWWLRSPGLYQDCAAIVDYGGDLGLSGYVSRSRYAVRPALWVNLNSDLFVPVTEQILFYQQAERQFQIGDYDGAIKGFTEAGHYSDAPNRVLEAWYLKGLKLIEEKDYEGAADAFEQAWPYSDSADKRKEALAQRVAMLLEQGDFIETIEIYKDLKTDSDLNNQLDEISDELYKSAVAYLNAGQYDEAYAIFSELKGYKDVDKVLSKDKNMKAIERIAKIEPYKELGNVVFFGNRNGRDMEWIVLDVEEDKVLLLCKQSVRSAEYGSGYDYSWEKCDIRKWLNKDFLKESFNRQEQNAILTTIVDNQKDELSDKEWNNRRNNKYSYLTRNNTKDKVFIQSLYEARKYANLLKEKAYQDWSWTRTLGGDITGQEIAVSFEGNRLMGGTTWQSKSCSVYPAIWVNLKANYFDP